MKTIMLTLVFTCLIPITLLADPPIVGSWENLKELKNYPGNRDSLIFEANGSFTYSGPSPFQCKWTLAGNIIKLSDCGFDGPPVLKIIQLKGDRLTIQFDSEKPGTYRRVAGPDTSGGSENPAPAGYAVNDRVQVLWNDQWYPAVILKVKGKKYFIHYDGYESSWDEWVGEDRMKK
ncbi:MAG: hypothetical protein KA369_10920 [Spirochaetes bacterium]|nr:hypothetical protein [Spirochaetota bacterium]